MYISEPIRQEYDLVTYGGQDASSRSGTKQSYLRRRVNTKPVQSAQGRTHHAPQILHTNLLPRTTRLALIVEVPDRVELLSDLLADDRAHGRARVAEAAREDDDVRLELGAVLEDHALFREALDGPRGLDLDLAVDDHLRRADVWMQMSVKVSSGNG